MDPDVYDVVGADFPAGDLHYGEDAQVNAVSALNRIARRPPKRILPPEDNDALDWHMRANCADTEDESILKRELMNSEAVERLSQRISWARKKRRLTLLETVEETETSLPMKFGSDKVLLHPPRSGVPWIGFTAPSVLQRFYITLRSAEPTSDIGGTIRQGCVPFNLGITEKVLNSLDAPLVPEIEPEEVETEFSSLQRELWVEKYAPHSYVDLISDENVNRSLLKWVRFWDECVFQRHVPDVVLKGASNEQQLCMSHEKPRRPLCKVVLLAGPAGAGKTTLSTIVAQRVGYRAVVLNASDERNVTDFEKHFEDTLRTTRTLGADSRPICLILDEIDGAPVQSIHFLCKAVAASGRHSLRRPVICICNNLYTPSLRELRSIALVLQLSRTDERLLLKRLEEISELEHLKVETSALTEIIAACTQDLRSSINALQFIASESSGVISRKAVLRFCERSKHFGDNSLYDSWASILEYSRHMDTNGRIKDPAIRLQRITSISEQHGGENDRFYMGLFTNYLNGTSASLLANVCAAIRQFCYYDQVITYVNSSRDYTLLKYLFVVSAGIHLLLCCRARVQLSFPSELQNALQRHQHSFEIIESVRAGAAQRNISLSVIAFEILPHLVSIVQPDLKPMNAQLYTVREFNLLRWIVSVMRSYALTYTAVSKDGSFSFVFKPAIDSVVMFAEDAACSANRSANVLSNAARQLIAHEIELEQLRSVDVLSNVTSGGSQENFRKVFDSRGMKSESVAFSYNQGSSSAIRRSIRMKNLFSK